MKDLAILVDNKNDSTEAQDLLFSMGYKWRGLGENSKSYFYPRMNKYFILMNKNEMDLQMAGYFAGSSRSYAESRFKEITIQELRDLVVLKRNNVGDATHTDGHYNFYVGKDKNYFFSSCDKAWRGTWKNAEILKPIEKQMKEYLRKNNDGEYILEVTNEREAQEPHAKHWIEVPVGVNFYYSFASGDKAFTKEHSSLGRLLWQRKTPFSINDQYAEIEKVRQSHRTASETADPTIKETLSQRQEQYGSFEDVAMFTEQMVDVMRRGYYEKLAYNQKMALYMICSKMARIVNGNPNHKDSWHNIAGYATLIDNELVSEKDMPF